MTNIPHASEYEGQKPVESAEVRTLRMNAENTLLIGMLDHCHHPDDWRFAYRRLIQVHSQKWLRDPVIRDFIVRCPVPELLMQFRTELGLSVIAFTNAIKEDHRARELSALPKKGSKNGHKPAASAKKSKPRVVKIVSDGTGLTDKPAGVGKSAQVDGLADVSLVAVPVIKPIAEVSTRGSTKHQPRRKVEIPGGATVAKVLGKEEPTTVVVFKPLDPEGKEGPKVLKSLESLGHLITTQPAGNVEQAVA